MAPNFGKQKPHYDMGTINEVLNRRDVRRMKEELRSFDADMKAKGFPGVQRAHAKDVRAQIVRVRGERVALAGVIVAIVAAVVGATNAIVAITKSDPAPQRVVTVVVKQTVPVKGSVRIRGPVRTK